MIPNFNDIEWNGKTLGFDLLMLNDQCRNQFYQLSMNNIVGKTVLDIGSGTGLLSVLAVQQGAKKVYAFEMDRNNYEISKKFIAQAGLAHKIELICADIMSVDRTCWPHEDIDVIITETFANDCFIQKFAMIVDHVERHFNLSANKQWIPNLITLKMGLIDVAVKNEFEPGVQISASYKEQINNAIKIYRDNFYHRHDEINMQVAHIPWTKPHDWHPHLDNLIQIDQFAVDQRLQSNIQQSSYHLIFDHKRMKNPYIKIDWVLNSDNISLVLNQVTCWKSIAFKVDRDKGSNFYFRFNPNTHALIGSQLPSLPHKNILKT